MKVVDTLHIIYDGQCAFCIRTLKVFRRLDIYGRLDFCDSTDQELIASRFPALRGAEVEDAIYSVAGDGQLRRGFFAFRQMIWCSPLTWLLVPLFYFPGSAFLGTRVYAWVARHRRQLGCEPEACGRPAAVVKDRLL